MRIALVRGCFCALGMCPLHRIVGDIDRNMYKDFLEKKNDPNQQSKDVCKWFGCRKMCRLDWPSRSPDLKIIEIIVAEKFPQLQEEWKKIDQACIDKITDSLPRRCRDVIDSKNAVTTY
ncbi:unnamed protein product [Caenorhabditis auriculariae]|uniref:Uncharacterized protein n=1 Tax=Caenorhabditis auriculariae TaxID=2777116 RepID=A0A8S1HGM9_9PELO|nr:unnamed protein product [Caenorhabditis auriculariae]